MSAQRLPNRRYAIKLIINYATEASRHLNANEQPASPKTPELDGQSRAKPRNWMVMAVLGFGLAALMLTCTFSSFNTWWRSTMGPLQKAAYDGDAGECARLVKSGVAVNTLDEHGKTALAYAIFQNHTAVVHKLIELGANVNHADDEGQTPLIYTVRAPFGKGAYAQSTIPVRNEIARLLLEHGAKVNHAQHHGDTALHWAVRDRNPELIRMLLAAGADPTARTSQGYTPLDIAKFPGYAPNDAVIAALQQQRP